MADAEHEPLLDGVDAPRPMPGALRGAVEASLLGGAMPDATRSRLEEELGGTATALLAGIDGPRPMPAAVRARLERALVPAPPRPVGAMRLLAVAAAVVTLLGAVGVAVHRPVTPQGQTLAGGAGDAWSDAMGPGDSVTGEPGAAPPTGPAGGPPLAPSGSGTTGGSAAQGGGGATRTGDAAPPFAFTLSAPERRPAAGTPLPVAVNGGGTASEAGFRAYVDLLNRSGGVRGRPVRVVAAGGDAIVTVNLGGAPLAARPPGRVVLEGFLTPESHLHDLVFGFASAPERQGRLAVDAVFPEPTPGARAVVYTEPSGPLATAVPDAMQAVLESRGVTVTRVAVDPSRPVVVVPADAAFLSVGEPAARAVLDRYRQAGMAPARGFAAIGTLADRQVARTLPPGTVVVSPFELHDNDESRIASSLARSSLSAPLLHGWLTAKALAVALWQSGAATPVALRAALEGLRGFDSHFSPPYRFRPGTHSLTPEGIVLVAEGGRLTARGGFRTDDR